MVDVRKKLEDLRKGNYMPEHLYEQISLFCVESEENGMFKVVDFEVVEKNGYFNVTVNTIPGELASEFTLDIDLK